MENRSNININNPFLSLRHKNFRLYWFGMCISLIGTWMQNIAQPWLAYSLTDSPLLLSLVGIMQFLPTFIFSLFAGVIIDRIPKKKILLFTQSASLIITLALALLVWLNYVRYWHILVASAALGLVNTLDMPARLAFVIEMVGKEDLANAIALNSSAFNIARVIGPALAGLVMGTLGVAACFYVNSISFAAVIIVLIFIKPLAGHAVQRIRENIFQDIKHGLQYVQRNVTLSKTILTVLIVGTFGMNFNVLVPVFSKVILHQEEAGFGLLMSFMGIGSFSGAMFVAWLNNRGPRKSILRIFPFIIAAFLICTGFTNAYAITALGLAVTGFFFVSFATTANSTVQFNTEDEYRGRVMSVYTWVFSGFTPVGNFYVGIITEHMGPSVGFIASGIIILALVFLINLLFKKKAEKLEKCEE